MSAPSPQLVFEGPDPERLLLEAWSVHGTQVRITEPVTVRRGGVGGFFPKEPYRIEVVPGLPAPAEPSFHDTSEVPCAVPSSTDEPQARAAAAPVRRQVLQPSTIHRPATTAEALDALVDGRSGPGAATPSLAPPSPVGAAVGTVTADPAAAADYRRHLGEALEGRRLDGLRVVVDCAHGAASAVAPEVVAELGADVVPVSCRPDGVNINDGCGSTHPAAVAAAVVDHRADLGLAFDGDADRLIAVDHTGAVVDGDVLLALFAVDMAERGELDGGAVVVTVMTNLGFHHAMARRGIGVRETPVGDRHVLAAVEAEGLALGGEQSGHIVFRRRATTGDGILTGLLLADVVARAERPLAELAAGLVQRVPQVLANVTVADPGRLAGAHAVWRAVAEVESELGEGGRVVLRPSGTEPLVRVMVEAPTEVRAAAAARRLCLVVEEALAG